MEEAKNGPVDKEDEDNEVTYEEEEEEEEEYSEEGKIFIKVNLWAFMTYEQISPISS